jgi:hypothetical protein
MKRFLRSPLSILLTYLFPVIGSAHEYWFEPDTFFPAPGEFAVVNLYVGDGLTKDREARPFQLAKTQMFQLFSSFQTWDLRTSVADGALPVYRFSADRAGSYLLGMERGWSNIKLGPKEFEDYLREDGRSM